MALSSQFSMNEQQLVAFNALCAEYDTVIQRRCAVLRDSIMQSPDMPRADVYRITIPRRSDIQARDTITNAALSAFSSDFSVLKKQLECAGYYSAVWDLERIRSCRS